MADLIKCTCCKFRGPQTDFPCCGDNLQYIKTCQPCTEKKNALAADKKRQKTGEDSEEPQCKRPRPLGKDTSSCGPPTLDWEVFTSLLANNKDSAFELHALVLLGDKVSGDNGIVLASLLAREIWHITGYRFK